jgi:Family of unknown function (DUF6572)
VGVFIGVPGGRAIPSSAIAANSGFVREIRADRERDSAARGELCGHHRLARRACFYEIVQNAVRHRFVERALVPIRGQIKLERLAFDAEAVRHIIDVDPGKIGLARDRTNGSEIVRFEVDPIVSSWRRIPECFQARFRRRSRNFRLASPEQRQARCFGFQPFHSLNVQRSTFNVQLSMAPSDNPQSPRIDTRIGVIDMIAHDTKTGEVVLVMSDLDPWDGSDERLLALQERFNSYVSFLLDGEMAEAHPELAGKLARIELRCARMPDTRALELLSLIHDQLAFQEIKMEVVVAERNL